MLFYQYSLVNYMVPCYEAPFGVKNRCNLKKMRKTSCRNIFKIFHPDLTNGKGAFDLEKKWVGKDLKP